MASWGVMATHLVQAAGFDANDKIMKQLEIGSTEIQRS
jgi:hypothetical protein